MGKAGEKASSNFEPCIRWRPMAMDFEHLMIWDISCYMGMGQNPVPLVNPKIAGKSMLIPLKMVLIGIDPYPYNFIWFESHEWRVINWKLVLLGFWLGIQAQTVWILELPYLRIPKIFMCWSTVIRHDRNHNLSETRGANMCNQKLKTSKMYLNKQPPNTQTKPWNHVVNPNQKFPIWNGFYNQLLLKFTTYHIVLQFWKNTCSKKIMHFLIFLAKCLRECAEMKGRPFMKKNET